MGVQGQCSLGATSERDLMTFYYLMSLMNIFLPFCTIEDVVSPHRCEAREVRSRKNSTPVATSVATAIGAKAHWKAVGPSGRDCRITPAATVHTSAVVKPPMFTKPEATPVRLAGMPSRAKSKE